MSDTRVLKWRCGAVARRQRMKQMEQPMRVQGGGGHEAGWSRMERMEPDDRPAAGEKRAPPRWLMCQVFTKT